MASRVRPYAAREQKEFKELFGYWKTLVGKATGVVTAGPLAGLVFDEFIAPGQEKYLPVAGVIGSVLYIIALYHMKRELRPEAIRTDGKRHLAIGATCAVAYIGLFYFFVVFVNDARRVRGLTETEEARAAVRNGHVADTSAELLTYFGYDSEDRIWVGRWLVMTLLAVVFVAGCLALAGGFFQLVLAGFVADKNALAAGKTS